MEICALHLKKITPNIASQENAKNLQKKFVKPFRLKKYPKIHEYHNINL